MLRASLRSVANPRVIRIHGFGGKMVALPLFRLGALFIRHLSKYGANRIKHQAHNHPSFRHFAARYGQSIHQLQMRLSVALLRDREAEQQYKEKRDAPTVKTEEEARKDEEFEKKHGFKRESRASRSTGFLGVWTRKFRPLPEAKAVDLFAEVIGDVFVLTVATLLVIYEGYRSSMKPDPNAEKMKELESKLRVLENEREEDERRQEERILALETALRDFKDPKTRRPLLAPMASP